MASSQRRGAVPRFNDEGLVREFDDVPSTTSINNNGYGNHASANRSYEDDSNPYSRGGMRPDTPRRMRQRDEEQQRQRGGFRLQPGGGRYDGDRTGDRTVRHQPASDHYDGRDGYSASRNGGGGGHYRSEQTQQQRGPTEHLNGAAMSPELNGYGRQQHSRSSPYPTQQQSRQQQQQAFYYETPRKSLPPALDDDDMDDEGDVVEEEDFYGERGSYDASSSGGGGGGVPRVPTTPPRQMLKKGQQVTLHCASLFTLLATIFVIVAMAPSAVWFKTEHQHTQLSPTVVREVRLWSDPAETELLRCDNGVVQNTNAEKDTDVHRAILALRTFTVIALLCGAVLLVFQQIAAWRLQLKHARKLKVLMAFFAPASIQLICAMVCVGTAYATFSRGDDSLAETYCSCLAPSNQIYMHSCAAGVGIAGAYIVIAAVLTVIAVILMVAFVLAAKPDSGRKALARAHAISGGHGDQGPPNSAMRRRRSSDSSSLPPQIEYSNHQHQHQRQHYNREREREYYLEDDRRYDDQQQQQQQYPPPQALEQPQHYNHHEQPRSYEASGPSSRSGSRPPPPASHGGTPMDRPSPTRLQPNGTEISRAGASPQQQDELVPVMHDADATPSTVSRAGRAGVTRNSTSEPRRAASPTATRQLRLEEPPVKGASPSRFETPRKKSSPANGARTSPQRTPVERPPLAPSVISDQRHDDDEGELLIVDDDDDDDDDLQPGEVLEEEIDPNPPELVRDAETGTMISVTDWNDVSHRMPGIGAGDEDRLYYSRRLNLYYDPTTGMLFTDTSGNLHSAEVGDA